MIRICSLLLMAWVSAIGFGQESPMPTNNRTALLIEPPATLRPRLGKLATLLIDQCLGCHNSELAEGGYSMATPSAMFVAGESRTKPIHVDPSAEADRQLGELYRRLVSDDPEERMPKDAPALDWDNVESIREWILFGAAVDGSTDAPLESYVLSKVPTTPQWEHYPRPQVVSALAINHASKSLFSSGVQEVLVWDFSGKLLGRIPTRGRFVGDIEWNAATECICVSSGEPGKVGYVESVPWSSEMRTANESGRVVHWIARDVPLDIALAPSGDRIAIGTQDGMLIVTAANSNSALWKSSAHAAAVTSVDWSEDGKYLTSSSRDRMAKSYEASTGEVLTSFLDHERTVASVRSLNIGCVTMDEAGTLRLYPGGTSPNPRASRGGFAQRTPKMASDRETVLVPVDGAIRRFHFRSEEVVESKGDDGKEKKKTQWIIDEIEALRMDGTDSGQIPLSVAIATVDSTVIAAGLASGEILVWPSENAPPIRIRNQPVGN